jgi:hypothetical protein
MQRLDSNGPPRNGPVLGNPRAGRIRGRQHQILNQRLGIDPKLLAEAAIMPGIPGPSNEPTGVRNDGREGQGQSILGLVCKLFNIN